MEPFEIEQLVMKDIEEKVFFTKIEHAACLISILGIKIDSLRIEEKLKVEIKNSVKKYGESLMMLKEEVIEETARVILIMKNIGISIIPGDVYLSAQKIQENFEVIAAKVKARLEEDPFDFKKGYVAELLSTTDSKQQIPDGAILMEPENPMFLEFVDNLQNSGIQSPDFLSSLLNQMLKANT